MILQPHVELFSDLHIDASRPAGEQHVRFAHVGWASSPPSAGQLMKLMVRDAEQSYNMERLQGPSYGQDSAPTRRDYFSTKDERYNGHGVWFSHKDKGRDARDARDDNDVYDDDDGDSDIFMGANAACDGM
jgi:hypothetical protein